METYTKKQMEVLKEFENNFYTALNAGYSRNVTASMFKALEDTTGEKCTNKSCTHCVLTFLRKIGEKYFRTKELFDKETELENAPKTSMEVIHNIIESDPEVKEQVKEMIKATNNEQNGKKRGRPRKDGNI